MLMMIDVSSTSTVVIFRVKRERFKILCKRFYADSVLNSVHILKDSVQILCKSFKILMIYCEDNWEEKPRERNILFISLFSDIFTRKTEIFTQK